MSLVHGKWAIHETIVTNFKRTSQGNEACGAKWPQNTAWAIIQTWVRVKVSGMVCVKCLQTNLYGPLLSPGASSAIGRRLFHRRPPGISIKGPPKPSHPGKWVKKLEIDCKAGLVAVAHRAMSHQRVPCISAFGLRSIYPQMHCVSDSVWGLRFCNPSLTEGETSETGTFTSYGIAV